MYFVFVHGCGQDWMFEDFEGGTLKEAERCALIMNKGDAARDYRWRYYTRFCEVN